MAKIDLTIPSLGDKFIDLRDSIPGDSYNFSWTRPLSLVNYLAIHHTAAPDTQTPEQIANFHINSNGWGGIGYHFLIAKDGTVYYVGDISTARANVANLNDQVIGICLIGNFTSGRVPTSEQLDSAHKLCDFFIGSYPDLSNVTGWDDVKGHKELPGQATTCPGDNWPSWRPAILEGSGSAPDRGAQISELKSQIDSLQTSLTSVNQQVIILQETLQEREQEIAQLRSRLEEGGPVLAPPELQPPKADTTLTIIQALFNLYKFIFWPRKVV